jgi:hypothetical protein
MAETIHGVMLHHPEKKEVPITSRNSIFFPASQSDGTPIMVYQGTGLVGSMLEAMNDCRQITGKETSCAFFDTKGNFYDNIAMHGLRVIKNGRPHHTAIFESDGEQLQMPADDIYCMAMPVADEDIALQLMANMPKLQPFDETAPQNI